ncbi:glycoside hydrolase/phage tail family protein [uncultured Pelagimonas sp.]|uniref:baseplate multidomain protein megatron n=1 Tax=uncultured Pelagimonas sp. TaxID=1618102 RepID=UPI00260522E2|nr:glycoside hydrolase/phage tail family protein [uncultured Pelagimonas sp.]
MATIALGAIGGMIGGSIGGSILGVSAMAIGTAVGRMAGSYVDNWVAASLAPAQKVEGPKLENLTATSSTEGEAIPRIYGRMKCGVQLLWATDYEHDRKSKTRGGGKGGPKPKVKEITHRYWADFAAALCEGEITGIGRIWIEGEEVSRDEFTLRVYHGSEIQDPDPLIVEKTQGPVPAYRGIAYVVFENFPVHNYGTIPQMSIEVFKAPTSSTSMEGQLQAVAMIPDGEFVFATENVMSDQAPNGLAGFDDFFNQLGFEGNLLNRGHSTPEVNHARRDATDFEVSLEQLNAHLPNVESVSLVVTWYGSDLRAGECLVQPGVNHATKVSEPSWTVGGLLRSQAYQVSKKLDGSANYGGTPADFAVIQGVRHLVSVGKAVTFYPFVMMDIPKGNILPDPYSDNASAIEQPDMPWRGRITCSPSMGYAGSVDQSQTAADQVAAFFGTAQVSDFAISGDSVAYTGDPNDWGYRRMILHNAFLCQIAGGVEAFLIGSELRGLTQIRGPGNSFPAVDALIALAADVAAILPGVQLSYAADWSEYHSYRPDDGSGDVFFHLDPLWSDPNIAFVGVDNYLPLTDWRDGSDHFDAGIANSIYDLDYLQAGIEGGEYADWFYASAADRESQIRTPITDGQGKPWVFANKNMRAWWSNPHVDRIGGIEVSSASTWVPQSKPITFTEIGCAAIDKGTNQPNVFYLEDGGSESYLPYFSRGWRDEAIQRRYFEAVLGYWNDPANNPVSPVYAGPMIDVSRCAAWAWDARPFPWFPALSDVWSDGPNHDRGHWLNGRAGAMPVADLLQLLCQRSGMDLARIDTSEIWQVIDGYYISSIESARASISVLAQYFGIDAVESDGKIVFRNRDQQAHVPLHLGELVHGHEDDPFEITRAQETELPRALKWTVLNSQAGYEAMPVEERKGAAQNVRESATSMMLATWSGGAEQRCRVAFWEQIVGREAISLSLPPNRQALRAGDVISLPERDGFERWRIQRLNQGDALKVEAVRHDPELHDMPPGAARQTKMRPRALIEGAPLVRILDLPQIHEDVPAHRPFAAVWADPWGGGYDIRRSTSEDGFTSIATVETRASIGVLKSDLPAGPLWLFDEANAFEIELLSGSLTAVSDTELFAGANALAIEVAPDHWEILQAGHVALIGTRRYRLSHLLRGQRGTEWLMPDVIAAGAMIVLLDENLVPLPISMADIGVPTNWQVSGYSAAAKVTELAVTPKGTGLIPFAPAHLKAAASGADIDLSWVRRDRLLSSESWALSEVPVSESSGLYQVEILTAAGAVLRTVQTNQPGFTWSAAMQAADIGAARFRVAQIGALGPGRARSVSINLT